MHSEEEVSLETLVENTQRLKSQFPKSKRKELRLALSKGEIAFRQFLEEQQYRGRTLPKFLGKDYHSRGFIDEKTPYFDMLEFIECYPEFALKHQKEDAYDHASA